MSRRRSTRRSHRTTLQTKLSFEKLDERVLLAADLSIVDEGFQGEYFNDLQRVINTNVLSVPTPFIGDALAEEIGSSSASSQFVAAVGQKLESVSLDGHVTIANVKSQVSSALDVSPDAITVAGRDGDRDIRFEVTLSQVQSYQRAVDLNLVGADPEIELLLGTEDQVDLDLSWEYKLAFGVREDNQGNSVFYFDSSASDDLSLDYTASIRDDFDTGKGRVGVFVAELGAGDSPSRYVGSYSLDLGMNQDGTPTVTGSLVGSGAANLAIDASFFPTFLPQGSAGLINLGVMADGVVTYETNLVFADGTVDATANRVTVGFENVRLDLGKLYHDFVDPLITNVQNNLKPIKPVVDFLTKPLPVVSDLYELAGQGSFTALTLAGYGANHPVTKTINVIDAILDYRGLPGAEGQSEEPLFSFEVSKHGVDPKTAADRAETVRENLEKLDRGELRLELADKHKNPEKHAEWEKSLSWNAKFGGSIDLPFLTHFETLAGFLLGDTSSDFFTFDIATTFSIDFDVSVPIVPLLNLVQLNAGFGIHGAIDLDGGYDALGVDRLSSVADFSSESALQQSLQDNQEYLIHGFYLDDHNSAAPGGTENGKYDKPEVTLGVEVSGGISAGVDLVLLQAKFGGNVVFEGNLEFDLNDLPDPNHAPSVWPTPSTPIWSNYDTPSEWNYDGRIRVNEFATIFDADPGAVFNSSGNLQVGLDATLEVSVIGITIIDEKWELFRVKLVDGSISHPNDARIIRGVNPPQIGVVNNGALNLFMGDTATRRTNAEPGVVDEKFSIQSLGDSKNGGETLMVVFESTSGEKYARVFDGVQKIVGSGGTGNDTIRVLPGVTSEVYLSGDAGNDILSADGSGPAVLHGGDGSDTLLGGGGDDLLVGGAGDDHLEGGSGNDTLDGGAGQDQLLGNAGDDHLVGGSEDDQLDGGHGDDQLHGGAGNDTLRGGEGNDVVYGDEGDDRIRFEFFLQDANAVDEIHGGANSDIVEIYGTEEADAFLIQELSSGTFQVTNGQHSSFRFSLPEHRRDRDIEEIRVSGMGGDDVIRAEGSFNVNRLYLSGGDGNDTLTGSDTRDVLWGGPGDDILEGGDGQDEVHGGDGADTLWGGADSDALYGDDGDDRINGGSGADVSYGGSGNDMIQAGEGFLGDLIDGGDGDDTLYGGPGIDTIRGQSGADRIDGGGLDDVLFGGDDDDRIVGGTGRDLLDGGQGRDMLFALDPSINPMPKSAWDAAIVELMFATTLEEEADQLNALLGHLAVSDSNDPTVAEQRKTLNNILSTRKYPTADEREVIDAILIDMDPTQSDSVDRLLGGDGDDHLFGTRYNDVLHGGAGSDEVHGETGDDQIQFELSGAEEGDLRDHTDVDHVIGGVHSDILEILGTERNDYFVIQQLSGGIIQLTNGRQESFQFTSPNAQGFSELRISGLGGDDTLEAVGHFDIGLRLDGGDGNDLIIGGDAADWLEGGAGADAIYGGGGDDQIDGGADDDILAGESGDDTIVGGTGRDIVQGGEDNDKLFAQDSNVQLFARTTIDDTVDTDLSTEISISNAIPSQDPGRNVLTSQHPINLRSESLKSAVVDEYQTVRVDELDGGPGDDRLRGSDDFDRLRGGDGNDVIVHSLGNDDVAGGRGDLDRYTFLFTDDSEFIDIALNNSGDVLVSRSLTKAESDRYVVGKANHLEIEVVGIEANGGDDRVAVDFGNQAVMQVHIDGGAGNDTFDVSLLPHNAVLWGGAGFDKVIQTAQPGSQPTRMVLTDTRLEAGQVRELKDIESADLTGNAGDNILDARQFSGSVKLSGEAGNDQLWGSRGDDILDGGTGFDLVGADGNVNFTLNDRRLYGMGIDVIRQFERAEIIGGSGDNVIDARNFSGGVIIRGGSGNDTLYGTNYADTIYGENGLDRIYGEDGNDTLEGGNDADVIYGGNGLDTLRGGNGNDLIYGGAHDDRLYGDDGNDTLQGDDGNDTLIGGNHNDVLYGGTGGDSLYGAGGNDRLYGESGDDYLDGGRDGIRDEIDGGSGSDLAVQYRRWIGWWIFGSWEYQESHHSIESTTNASW